MSISLASLDNHLYLMVAGLKRNLARIQKRGIDENFIVELEALRQQISRVNIEQENLKGELRTKTAELHQLVKKAELNYREAKKVVKLEIEQILWGQFGIKDKK